MGERTNQVGKLLSKVTPGKRYKNELKIAEEQYKAIFEYTGAGMIVISPDMTIIEANHKASEISGYPLEILKSGHKWSEFIHNPDELKHILDEREQRMHDKNAIPIKYETSFQHANGSRIHLLVSASQIPGSDNVLSSFIDVTDLHEVHEKLLESEKRFKEMAELLPVIICEINREMEFTYVNKIGHEIFGYGENEITTAGIKLTNFFVEDEIPRLLSSIEERWKDHKKSSSEYRMVTTSGDERVFLIISSVMLSDGIEIGIRSCLVDVTDYRRIENELADREYRLRTIFDSSPLGITILDQNGFPQEMNRAFCELFSISSEDRIPSLFEMLNIDKKDIVNSIECVAGFRLIQTESSEILECVKTDAVLYSWHITPLAQSGDTHYICQVVDITEQQKAEQSRISKTEKIVAGLKKELGLQKNSLGKIESHNAVIQNQIEMLPTISDTSATLLITGESGTGKELWAQTIHQIGERKSKPFVAINCGALPENLLESELFGHTAGAFTDAKKDRKGKFLSADGGVIFLDEIGELSLAMQVKLLRVLQERSFEPVGSDKTISVDVRVIAATHRDLAAMVKDGTFREDLFYRIKVLHLNLPALRNRREDIPLLCDYLLVHFNNRYNKSIQGISTEALDALLSFPFPGNIRELQNVLEHAFIFCKGSEIELQHLPEEFGLANTKQKEVEGSILLDSIQSFDELERLYLEHQIKKNNGNKTETAKSLGMHKATLFRKLKRTEK